MNHRPGSTFTSLRLRCAQIALSVVALSGWVIFAACDEPAPAEDPASSGPPAVLHPIAPEVGEEPDRDVTVQPPLWQAVSLPELGRYGLASVWTRGDEVILGGTGEVFHFDGTAWSGTSGPFTASGAPRARALTHIVQDGDALLLLGSRGTIARYDGGLLTVEHQNWRLNARQTHFPWATRCGDELYIRTRGRGYHRVSGQWTQIDWRDAPCADARPDAPAECLGLASRHNGAWTIRCRGTDRFFVYWAARSSWVRCPPGWVTVASLWGDETALYSWGGDHERSSMQRWDGEAWTVEAFPAVDRVAYIHGDQHLLHAVTQYALFRRGRGPARTHSE